MRLTNENVIREFFTKISYSCTKKDCKSCPLYLRLKNSEVPLSACLLINNDPEKWNVDDIIERYREL